MTDAQELFALASGDPAALRRLVAELSAENARLRAALEKATARFREYAEGHFAKGQPIKAARNADMASMCLRALVESDASESSPQVHGDEPAENSPSGKSRA